jgi:hypothetical protein
MRRSCSDSLLTASQVDGVFGSDRQDGEAIGRSRGGFSTKIHLKTDLDGYPIGFHLTGGEARNRGICPVIPYRSNTIGKPKFFAKVLYNARARIEQMMGKIKRVKRIALRCEKTARNYASFLALVCGFILIKSVHTA